MGKYKSYIFLGLTVLILLLVGYCVAKNSKGKKEDKKEVVKTEEGNVVTDSISQEQEVDNVKPIENNTINQQNKQVKPENEVTELPKPKQVKQEIYDAKLEFRGNNYISWNPKLATSGASLSLIIERNGSQVEVVDVSGVSGHSYVPGSEGDLKKTKVILKIEGVEYKGKTFFTTNEFTCSIH